MYGKVKLRIVGLDEWKFTAYMSPEGSQHTSTPGSCLTISFGEIFDFELNNVISKFDTLFEKKSKRKSKSKTPAFVLAVLKEACISKNSLSRGN